jgi:hypothetical protein
MNLTKVYERSNPTNSETLTVMAYIGAEEGDGDEIRIIHVVAGSVVEDGIAYHGRAGEQWLRDWHTSWTADGYEMTSSGPGT